MWIYAWGDIASQRLGWVRVSYTRRDDGRLATAEKRKTTNSPLQGRNPNYLYRRNIVAPRDAG
jgi:hypothetical protein